MKGDLSVIGPQATIPHRVAAAASRFEMGEPLISVATLTTGAASTNVFTLAAADFVVAGTNFFGGIALENAEPKNSSGALVAQTVSCACPVGHLGRVRGKAETAGNIDTAAELLAIIQDAVLIDGTDTTGAVDGGPLFTIKDTASADTSLFTIVEGDIVTGTLDVVMDSRGYRTDNDIAG